MIIKIEIIAILMHQKMLVLNISTLVFSILEKINMTALYTGS